MAMSEAASAGIDQPQRKRSAQHFERKQRAAERHAIDGGHARAGADRNHQAALFVRKLLQVGSQVAEDRAELFGPPSRPSGAPMPTMTIDSTALPSVLSAGRRPA